MNKLMASPTAIALFLLAGCAASGPKLASSAEDIVGTWQSTISAVEIQFNDDGTYRVQDSDGRISVAEFRFEGTRFFAGDASGDPCTKLGYETGIFEVELLENGNLKFSVIEDGCLSRANIFVGALIEKQFEPVP